MDQPHLILNNNVSNVIEILDIKILLQLECVIYVVFTVKIIDSYLACSVVGHIWFIMN